MLLDAWWLTHFRRGAPLDVDEQGYMSTAFDLSSAVRHGDWSSFRQVFLHHGPFGPLLALVTIPIHLIFGARVFPGFFAQVVFFGVLIWASFGLGVRLAGKGYGILVAVVVATLPGIIDFERTFHFVIPSTAMFTAAAYALVRSEGLTRRRWAIAFGLFIALTLLARTYMVALVPGLLIAAALRVLLGSEGRARRALNLGLGLGACAILALPWYWANLHGVWDYLLQNGYGAASVDRVRTGIGRGGGGRAPYLVAQVAVAVQTGLYVPYAAVLGAAAVAGPAAWARATKLRKLFGHEAGSLAITFAWGYVALTTTKVHGTGFFLPLLPVGVALAIASMRQLPARTVRSAFAAALILLAAFNVLSKLQFSREISRGSTVGVPGIGPLTVIQGRGTIQRYVVQVARYRIGTVTSVFPPQVRRWVDANERIEAFVARYATSHRRSPVLTFAAYDSMFNTNSVGLESRLAGHRFPINSLHPAPAKDTIAGYVAQLRQNRTNVFITLDTPPHEFLPRVTRANAEEAAQQLGFRIVAPFDLPDGRKAFVWWRG